YRNRLEEIGNTADQLMKLLQQLAEPPAPDQPITIDEKLIDELIERSVADFDPRFGGFGGAPKFPRETLLELLLTDCAEKRFDPKSRRLQIALLTLDKMADGGMRDHLGGGFHRYSTDARWLVPHFEIM